MITSVIVGNSTVRSVATLVMGASRMTEKMYTVIADEDPSQRRNYVYSPVGIANMVAMFRQWSGQGTVTHIDDLLDL